jgi:hypothetical protein
MKTPRSHQTSPINQPDRWPAKAVALAVALHTPYFLNSKCGEAWEERDNIVHAAKERIKSALVSRPLDRNEYTVKLKENLESGSPIDLGEFYLKTEYIEGRINEAEMKVSLEKLSAAEADLRVGMEEKGVIKTLQAITDRQGDYSGQNSYLSSALDEKKGNCQAREKRSAALVQRLYPEAKIAYQSVKIEGQMHTRTLVKIDGQWHNMENPEVPMTDKELEGTVLYDKYDYVRNYAGEKPIGEFKKLPDAQVSEKTHTKLTATDDYLGLPMPEGVNTEDITDIGAKDKVQSVPQGDTMEIIPMVEQSELNSVWFEKRSDGKENRLCSFYVYPMDISDGVGKGDLYYLQQLAVADEKGIMSVIEDRYPDVPEACLEALAPIVRLNVDNILRHCWKNETSNEINCYYEIVWTPTGFKKGGGGEVYFREFPHHTRETCNAPISLIDATAVIPADVESNAKSACSDLHITSLRSCRNDYGRRKCWKDELRDGGEDSLHIERFFPPPKENGISGTEFDSSIILRRLGLITGY